ncbi:hypothetical protein LINPERPRIM_LOCUS11921 [Linum perenne]
MQIPQGL